MSEIRSQATPARDDTKNKLATAVLELLNRAAQIGTPGRAITAHVVARGLSADGWSKPRTVNSAAELNALGTGTVVRSKHGDIGSIDHGPQGNWTTRIWMLDFISHGSQSVAEFAEYAGLPATVLFTPGESG